jgi:hypothetical protein
MPNDREQAARPVFWITGEVGYRSSKTFAHFRCTVCAIEYESDLRRVGETVWKKIPGAVWSHRERGSGSGSGSPYEESGSVCLSNPKSTRTSDSQASHDAPRFCGVSPSLSVFSGAPARVRR